MNLMQQHNSTVLDGLVISEWVNARVCPYVPEDAASFLRLFRGTLYTYLDDAGSLPPIVDRATFDPNEIPPTYGAYFSVNGFKNGKRKGENLAYLNAVHCDADLVKNGIEKTREWLNDTLMRLTEAGIPPTAVVETKNGYHFYWLFEAPIELEGNERVALLARHDALLKAIPHFIEAVDTSAAEAVRIMRIPGTEHRKDIHLGPEHAFMCRLVSFKPSITYTLEALEETLSAKSGQTSVIPEAMPKPSLSASGELPLLLEGIPEHGNEVAEGRNVAATRLFGRWWKLGLSEEEVWLVGQKWNAKNQPPLSESELRSVYDSTRKYDHESQPFTASAIPQENSGTIQRMQFIPDTELLTMDTRVEWAVERLFAKGTLNMISAPPQQYKSWLVLRMAVCISQGLPVFGEFETEKTNVLIVNEDDNHALIKERYAALFQEGEQPGGVYFVINSGRKITGVWAGELLYFAKQHNIGFIALDTLRSLHNGDENQSNVMQEVMDNLSLLTRQGITVLFTQHHRKSQPGAPGGDESKNGLDMVRGSSAIAGAVHGHLTCIEKKTDGHYLVVYQHKIKAAERLEPFIVNIEQQRAEPLLLGFTYGGRYDADVAAVDSMESRLLEHFREHPQDFFTRGLLVDLQFAKNEGDKTLRDALASLVSKKIIGRKKFSELTGAEQERFLSGDQKTPSHRAAVYWFVQDAPTEEREREVEIDPDSIRF